MINNRGAVFWLGYVITALIVLLYVYVWSSSFVAEEKIGTDQSKIFSAFQEGQKELFYLDVSGTYALINSVYELARRGGFSSGSACGDYYNISLWSYKNAEDEFSECIPKLASEIVPVFGSFLNQKQFFRFFAVVDGGLSMVGVSPSPVNISIGSTAERVYSFKPSFNVNIPYSGEAYGVINDFADELNKECSVYENSGLSDCVQGVLAKFKHGFISLGLMQADFSPEVVVRERMKELERVNFVECFAPFRWEESYALEFGNRFENTEFSTSVFHDEKKIFDAGVSVVVAGENSFGVLAPYPSQRMLVENEKLVFDSNEKEIDGRDMFVFSEGISAFVPRDEKNKFISYLEQRPCEYENRIFPFELVEKEFYPDEGSIAYDFAVYVKDDKAPEFSGFYAEDKEFDEDTLLVKWKHTDSLDLKRYEIFVDGKLVKSFTPWKDVGIYDGISWSAGSAPFNGCELVGYGLFKKCLYSGIDIERGKVYFFRSSREFVYSASQLMPGRHIVSVKAVDDDNNFYEAETEGLVVDDLPILPLSDYVVSPVLLPPDETKYNAVNAFSFETPLWNMDGTAATGFSGYILFEDAGNAVRASDGKSAVVPLVLLDKVHSIAVPSEFLLVPEDPSLEHFVLYLDVMGYKKKVVPG
jgi:hypothetical protein